MGAGSGNNKRISTSAKTPSITDQAAPTVDFKVWPTQYFKEIRRILSIKTNSSFSYPNGKFPAKLNDIVYVSNSADELMKYYVDKEDYVYSDEEVDFMLTELMRDMISTKSITFSADSPISETDQEFINQTISCLDLDKLSVYVTYDASRGDAFNHNYEVSIGLFYNDKYVNDITQRFNGAPNYGNSVKKQYAKQRITIPNYIVKTLFKLFDESTQ